MNCQMFSTGFSSGDFGGNGKSVMLSGMESIKDLKSISYNLQAPRLVEDTIRRGEAMVAKGDALSAETGVHPGRSPSDKFIVNAVFAASVRCSAVNRLARTRPPLAPPSLPNATAAGFFPCSSAAPSPK